jgi:hypothetical protein
LAQLSVSLLNKDIAALSRKDHVVKEVERFHSETGNIILLRHDGDHWDVANIAEGGEILWIETSVSGTHPFTEEEARAEFERWRV